MEVTNKTRRPLAIPLPGGKKLRLGPLKTGQIAPKAADHPLVKKLIEAGEIEIVGDGRTKGSGSLGSGGGGSSSQTDSSSGGVRHTGDR